MDFNYSEELLEIKRIAREFAENEIRPHVIEMDEQQSSPVKLSVSLRNSASWAFYIPAEYGGAVSATWST